MLRPLSFPLLRATLCVLLGTLSSLATPTSEKVPDDKDQGAYLLVYFKDDTHGLYFALSRDGYTFGDVNQGSPIMEGRDLAEQKGIRDPHIARGPDGAFYLTMTDLHLFGQKAGFRDTEWERPSELYDWGNNRAIVLMKSKDLVNWSHSIFRIDRAFEETREVGCFWAPETLFDPENGRPMVYFTMRLGHGKTKLYYSYADGAFTKLETVPVEFFKHPEDQQILDADITRIGDRFHLFYVAQGKGGGIKQSVSAHANRAYAFDPESCTPEKLGHEAPNLWRRHGTDTYVLMYDVYGAKPNNMGFCETKDFKTFRDLGHFNEGVMRTTNFSSPKHGAVIALTEAEARRLAAHWNFDYDGLPAGAVPPI